MPKFGSFIRALSRVLGSSLRDVNTGELLGKAFVVAWRGRVHIIGYTGSAPLRPVAVPGGRLSYARISMGFTAPTEPDFPKLR